MKTLTSTIYGAFLTVLISTSLTADCSYELFSISSAKNTKIMDFVEQLSDECEYTVIANDTKTQKFLNTTLNKTHIKNLTINEVLDLILTKNNLSYTLENNVLNISYLTTKVFSIDYILSQRKSTGSTDVTLSSSTDAKTAAAGGAATGEGGTSAESGIKIESNDEVKFWEQLDLEFQSILNRPHDSYVAEAPIINKNAGLVTVTSTVHQMKRFEDYLKQLQDKVQLQVLIDVKILSVTMSDHQSTGIDWAQLYALQNINLSADILAQKNVATFTPAGSILTATADQNPTQLLQISANASLNEVIKFLKTQGDVNSLSNPKVLTLNNQPALITVGTEHFYKITSSDTLAGGTTATTTQEDEVKSVFAGVLLDITPEIADDKTITLKINPSLSETTTDISASDNSDRTMPPDLKRRQLSSVVTVKDGNRIILGGLINTRNTINSNKIPLLGDIPILGWAFKHEEKVKSTEELIIIIEPHIISKEKSTLSLKDLGYKGMKDELLNKTEVVLEEPLSVDAK